MKIDRLLGIVVFLLNHRQATANELASTFEVSVRTIKRDMDTINLAGIPINSTLGVNGGYSIEPRFTLNRQYTTRQDYATIITALMGLESSYHTKKTEQLLNKYLHLIGDSDHAAGPIYLDNSIAREGMLVQHHLQLLEKAILHRQNVHLWYRNAKQETSERMVQPIALSYKWYDWYLFAYCEKSKDYRQFKLVRMKQLELLDTLFNEHRNVENLMHEHEQSYSETSIAIDLLVQDKDRDLLAEYFPKGSFTRMNNEWMMRVYLPEYEMMWKAKLIALGSRVKITRPEFLRQELITTAQSFIANNETRFSVKNLP
ncbi:WYL domain-containing protein [Sporolactobacillus shoreicorticis]|uniref:Helix-turn-helix transcriptional regulator n=1 Tax=Sporolactobacillus shoreicorticis TaxID=1923877 RepID=A0ABW5S7S6_9BACL|nr:WYL domain-containing protein [Sporolactobacillus shoreicorticis]MCO7126896.1 WYL domain-containing protein [Sporolactobacillus shoreicorticis]